jgi:hypothetical protein
MLSFGIAGFGLLLFGLGELLLPKDVEREDIHVRG